MVAVIHVAYKICKTRNVPFSCAIVLVFVLFGTSMLISSLRLLHRQEFPLVVLVFTISRLAMRTFLEQDLNPLDYFLSEIMDIYFVAGSDKQAEQSNHLAEGLSPL